MQLADYVFSAALVAIVAAVFVIGVARRRPLIVASRLTAQAAFLVFFLFLLTQAVVPLEGYLALKGILPVDLFVRLSPLAAAAAMLAARAAVAGLFLSIVTLVSAFVAGRFFCGWVCPLGTTFDVLDALFFKRLDRPQSRDSRLRSAKYLLLAGVLAAAVFGAQVAGWLDPMSIVTRSYAVAVLPAADRAAKVVLEKPLESETLRSTRIVAKTLGRTESVLRQENILYDADHYYVQFGVFMAALAALVAVQAYQKRFWCRKLCPLGAMLGLAGKWRPVGVRLDAGKCVDCGRCGRVCPVGAIQGRTLYPEECTFCGLCIAPCPVGALTLSLRARRGAAKADEEVIPGRREFLLAAASGVAAAPILMMKTQRRTEEGRLVRPPGAQDEERFVAACVRCGECMKACPTNALHPAGFEAGLAGVWTPKIVPVIGYCDYNCIPDGEPVGNFCAAVCPTGAIRKLTPRQKHDTHLGTAYLRTDKCIPYVERTDCSVCVEHCPVPEKALKDESVDVIDLKTGQPKKLLRPYVDKVLCVGCGQCENVCPLKGEKGIRVEPVRSLI